jgi:hypothetical protein
MDLPLPPFVTGLIAGLVIGLGVAGYFWFAGWLRRRALVKEVASLKEHLHRQMEINAKGTDAQKKELEGLREKTENLRITNATLKQKPGHAEIELLATYERALRAMHSRAPGFGAAWEQALKEAEAELAAVDTGLMPLIRKALKPVLGRMGGSAPAQPQLEAPETAKQLMEGEPKPDKGGASA